jgi:hypothetical protein
LSSDVGRTPSKSGIGIHLDYLPCGIEVKVNWVSNQIGVVMYPSVPHPFVYIPLGNPHLSATDMGLLNQDDPNYQIVLSTYLSDRTCHLSQFLYSSPPAIADRPVSLLVNQRLHHQIFPPTQ